MLKIKKYMAALAFLFAPVAAEAAPDLTLLDQENLLMLQLTTGMVAIEMRPDKAPNHVARIKELVGDGFYDGLTFHRVIDGFMAQTGDPNGDGTGGSGQRLEEEFNSLRLIRGRAAMAREAEDENSADSQFFIMLNTRRLMDRYTAWGRVVDGMRAVDNIKKGNPNYDGRVMSYPDKIIKAWIAADQQ